MTDTKNTSTAPAEADVIAQQVAAWRREVARLQDLISHATGGTAPAGIDLDKIQRYSVGVERCTMDPDNYEGEWVKLEDVRALARRAAADAPAAALSKRSPIDVASSLIAEWDEGVQDADDWGNRAASHLNKMALALIEAWAAQQPALAHPIGQVSPAIDQPAQAVAARLDPNQVQTVADRIRNTPALTASPAPVCHAPAADVLAAICEKAGYINLSMQDIREVLAAHGCMITSAHAQQDAALPNLAILHDGIWYTPHRAAVSPSDATGKADDTGAGEIVAWRCNRLGQNGKIVQHHRQDYPYHLVDKWEYVDDLKVAAELRGERGYKACDSRVNWQPLCIATSAADAKDAERSDQWARGYFCAVGVALREDGDTAIVRSLFAQGGDAMKADPLDVELFIERGLLDRSAMAASRNGEAK
jgi:hypothetical protein